jgi:hypothetical protein
LLKQNPQITHIASVSVFEHIPDEIRRGMTKAINEFFKGQIFVTTLEYHSRNCYFEYQLTPKTLSELFIPLERFYPDKILQSPVLGESAYQHASLGRKVIRRLFPNWRWRKFDNTPLWYPLALRFRATP